MSHTVIRTQTVQEPPRYQVIHLVAQPALPNPAAPSTDPILDCLQDMLEEGFISQRDLAVIIENYKQLPGTEGFAKAILLCHVICKMVRKQIEVESNELILSHLFDCEDRLKLLLQGLLVADIKVEDFLAQYDNRCMQMQDDLARQQKISQLSKQKIQQMNGAVRNVEQEIIADYNVLAGRISRLAEFKSQMTEEQHRKLIDLKQRIENARQQTMNHAVEVDQLEERLKLDKQAFKVLTQDLRALMEKVQKL